MRCLVNLQQLISFCAVLNEGSMTAAAEKLFLTQPAVSQQIRNLEEELGVELLVRGARNIRPSLQGQLLYDYAKRIIYLTQQAEVAIQSIGAEIKGHIRIGTLNSIGLYLISPVVGLFLKHNSQLKIKLVYGRGEELIERLNQGELDVAILPDGTKEFGNEPKNVEKRFLMKDEMWLVGPGRDVPSHQISLEEFIARPLVILSENYPKFTEVLKKEVQKNNLSIDPVFETSNVGTLKRVIESGLGWGFLPSHSIAKQVRIGRLTHLEVNDFAYPIDFYYYISQEMDNNPSVEIFYRALKQQINSQI